MENYIQEKYIENSPNPLTIEGTETILFQMKNSICKIISNDGKKGTGFFCKIPYLNKLLPVLITNNHILDENSIAKGKKIEITLNDDKIALIINIDNSRIKFTNKELDITLIEIKQEKDKINNFLEIDENIDKGLENIYNHKSIYLLHYPKGLKANVSYGLSGEIINYNLIHFCSTEEGSSGGPILFLDSFKVIGIHKGTTKNKNLFVNLGSLIKNAIRFFNLNNNFINNNKAINDNIFINKVEFNPNNNNIKMNNKINLSQNSINLMNKEKDIYLKENNKMNDSKIKKTYDFIIPKFPKIVSNPATLYRLKKEFDLCSQDIDLATLGCNFGLENENIYIWRTTMLGPKNTPYADGIFTILIIFPFDYPNHGPEFKFRNKIYHLCVGPEDGHICFSAINEWRTCGKVKGQIYNVKRALIDIFCFFYENYPESAYSEEMANQYVRNREKFYEEAKKWTKLYAS